MTNVRQLVINNHKKYPREQIQDVFKLLYQREFGCGHLVRNFNNNFQMLQREWESTAISEDCALVEDIGNNYVRINIASAKRHSISMELFQRIFIKSAEVQSGTREAFLESIEEFKNLCVEQGYLDECDQIDEMVFKWKKNNYPLFSHTEGYREAYKPAYRVVLRKYAELIPVINEILKLKDRKNNGSLIVAIDGRCGSGKSTLACNISNLLGCSVVHMDDFFLPFNMRSKERLQEPGGNIHYERFCEEVREGILDSSKDRIQYGKFNCSKMAIDSKVEILKSPIIIIEGSYALHEKYRAIYDYKIFCTVDKATQKSRIVDRNGEKMYENFKHRWIPLEEKYFSTMKLEQCCEYIFDTGNKEK